jgi:SAM-dependent methyltransferase
MEYRARMVQPPPSPLAMPMPWDLVAPGYVREVVPMFETFAREALRLAAPPPGARVVDVACGPGTLAVLAAQAGHRVDALDFSPRMLELLGERARVAGVTIAAQVGDGQALPYADGTFAAGFSLLGLIFFPDRAKGFAELARVLAPGARAVVSSWPPFDTVPVMNAIGGVMRTFAGPAVGTAPPLDQALSTEELCRVEMSASFADVQVHRVRHVARFASLDDAWRSISSSVAPMVLLRKKLGEDKWREVDVAGRAAVERALGGGAPEIPLTALVSVGVKR